jgi:hypothetical protein
MRARAAILLALIGLISVRSVGQQTATLDSVDIQDLGGEFLAIRDGASPTRVRLIAGEKALWYAAEGAVGLVLTDRRFLAVSPNSSGWQEVRLRPSDGRSPPVELAANVALLLSPRRVLGFSGRSGVLSETSLTPQEVVVATGAQEHVGVVVTNRRTLGWASRFAGSAERALGVHESFESLRVGSTTASVRTTKRVLSFDSSSALWRDESIPIH